MTSSGSSRVIIPFRSTSISIASGKTWSSSTTAMLGSTPSVFRASREIAVSRELVAVSMILFREMSRVPLRRAGSIPELQTW